MRHRLSTGYGESVAQTILVIKDFAEKKEIKDQSMLWNHQVKDLFHRLGN